MTYQEFKDKYNGQYLNYDGYYSCQCWDLAQYYFTECLGLPESVLSGCGMVNNMLYPPKREVLDKYFDEVDVHDMHPGDVCIWDYGNGVGHIAIFDSWDGLSCWYFSQNYPLNSNSHLQVINDTGIHAFRLKSSRKIINLPPDIQERNVYKIDTKEQFATLKPAKFGGLSYQVYSMPDNGYYAEIETANYGRCLVRVTDKTPITSTPLYERGNY